MKKYLVCIPFPGFYETSLSQMVDDEIVQAFTDENGHELNVPDELYYKCDFSDVRLQQAKFYLDAWCDQFKDQTGLDLKAKYESYTSPREYNFETDRLFAHFSQKTIKALFKASKADNHKALTAAIKDRFTSYSGFISGYSNDLENWLFKPLLTWDHNEFGTLLIAVLNIHCTDDNVFDTWSLMESYQCNGNLSNDVWSCFTKELREFADIQRARGEAVDYDLWLETGKIYPDGTDRDTLEDTRELPTPRCPLTLDLFAWAGS